MDNKMAKLMPETINNMMLELYASMAEAELDKKEKGQREGNAAKKLQGEWDDYGRPAVIRQAEFNQEFMRVYNGEIGLPPFFRLAYDAYSPFIQGGGGNRQNGCPAGSIITRQPSSHWISDMVAPHDRACFTASSTSLT